VWQDHRLIHYPQGDWVADSPPLTLAPLDEEWQAFWSIADELDAWHWRGNFGRHVVCGSPWTLDVEYRGLKIQCAGNGVDEQDGPRSAVPSGFERLYEAMCRLINRPTATALGLRRLNRSLSSS
jgi:hypothetical protein